MAAASTRDVTWLSAWDKAGSETRMASEQPIARACLRASVELSPPILTAMTLPLCASACWRAASTAYSSQGLMTRGESPQFALPSKATNLAAESGTCLTQNAIFKFDLLSMLVILYRINV